MLFSVEYGVVPRAPTDALQLWRVRGCARGAYFAIEIYIYMNLYYLITVVNKIIVFLKLLSFLILEIIRRVPKAQVMIIWQK